MSVLTAWIRTCAGPLRRRWGGLAALLLAVLTLACSGSASYNPAGGLEVGNGGTRSMTRLYVTPSTNPDWGPNQLGAQPLPAGGALLLGPMSPGHYDVQAIFSDGVTDTVNDVRILDGSTARLTMTNVGAVTVENTTNLWIIDIYLVPHSATDWGVDQLNGTLLPGRSFQLTDVTAGSYDLRVVFQGGSTADYLNVAVDPAATTTIQVQ